LYNSLTISPSSLLQLTSCRRRGRAELINGKPFESTIAAVKILGVDRGHFITSRLDSNKPCPPSSSHKNA